VILVTAGPSSYPLTTIPGPIPAEAVRDQLQLVLTDRTRPTERPDFGLYALRS
jgi:hypothetical protein